MHLVTENTNLESLHEKKKSLDTHGQDSYYCQYKVIRRSGEIVTFDPNKISIALTKAFIAVDGSQDPVSERIYEVASILTEMVVNALLRRQPHSGKFHIEDIQDQVELALLRTGEHKVARAYVIYRKNRARDRARLKVISAADKSEDSFLSISTKT